MYHESGRPFRHGLLWIQTVHCLFCNIAALNNTLIAQPFKNELTSELPMQIVDLDFMPKFCQKRALDLRGPC